MFEGMTSGSKWGTAVGIIAFFTRRPYSPCYGYYSYCYRDGITGILITYVATQIGFATSWMNTFRVAIAQGIAGVPILSGRVFRIIMWAILPYREFFLLGFMQKVSIKIQKNL